MKKELSINIDMLLTELNNTSLTNGEKAEILTTIIDLESEKPDGDMDLIRECLDYLAFLNNAGTEASAEQLPERLQRIYQKAGEEDSAGNGKNTAGRKRRLRKAGIAAAIIAAILLVAVTSLTVIARVQGYDDVLKWISAHWAELPDSGQITSGDTEYTWYKYKESKKYDKIEAWLEEAEPDILYPSVMPDGFCIGSVEWGDRGDGMLDIMFFSDPWDIIIEARNYDLFTIDNFKRAEIIEVNGYRAAILYAPESAPHIYQAYLTVGEFSYIVEAPDRETLLFLLENLKKSGS